MAVTQLKKDNTERGKGIYLKRYVFIGCEEGYYLHRNITTASIVIVVCYISCYF